jgi:D-galactonate transporter
MMSNPEAAIRPGVTGAAPTAAPEEDAVWSKITWRVMPVILIAYSMAFLDRINVGYAKLTMQQDLQFSDAVYGLGAGIFFITYLIFEVPSNLWLEKIGARLSFLRIMVLWGLTSAATAWVATPTQFYIVRLLLGVFEAGFFPGVILYLTYWYPSHRRGRVTGLFLFGMPITGAIGGPLSGWIMKNWDGVSGWHGWQWLFVLEGIPTVLIGFIVYFLLANKPAEAKFLSEHEKRVVVRVMDADQKGAAVPHHHGKLAAAFADPKTWVLAFVYFVCAAAVYTLTFWMPTMVKALGVKDIASIGWYTSIPFVCGSIAVLVLSRSSDHFKERRMHVAIPLMLGVMALYATAFLTDSFVPAMVMLSVAAALIFGGGALFWSIPPTYLSREAAATGIAVISSLGILGGFVSPTLIGYVKTVTGSINNGLLVMTLLTCAGGLTLLLAVPKSALRVGDAPPAAGH